MDKENCGWCKCWFNDVRSVGKHPQYGECHNKSPVTINKYPSAGASTAIWPITFYDDWCAEWKPAQKTKS